MPKYLRLFFVQLAVLAASLLVAADVPSPTPAALLSEYQALYDTATTAGDALVARMNADVIALRSQVATLTSERDAAVVARDAALKAKAELTADLESLLAGLKGPSP